MLKTIAIAAAVLLTIGMGTVLAIACSRPAIFRVVRTAHFHAPAEQIYPHIANLKAWREWSEYERKDPDMQGTYSGAEEGVGAAYEWNGDDNIGQGRMEIIEATPTGRLKFTLEFIRPFACRNTVDFTLEPDGDGTQVTWDMQGPSQFVPNVMSVFIDMDAMVGRDFEAGLANLKGIVEGQAQSR